MQDKMQKRPNPVNHAMQMGLRVGLWMAFSFILEAQGWNFLSMLVSAYVLYGVYCAGQHYKRMECGGKIGFGAAYSYVLWLYLCSALVAALLRYAYLQWLNPEYLPKMYEQAMPIMEQLVAANPQVDMDVVDESVKMLLTPIRFSLYYIMVQMLTGSLWGLLLAVLVKRTNLRVELQWKNGGKKNDKDADGQDKLDKRDEDEEKN